ncbi:MAG: type II/IV secretion system protein [Planctomycetales bacterium]|nr:type II/IV secretion system protein [Planctomycetales bacterium]
MMTLAPETLAEQLRGLDARKADYATRFVDTLLAAAVSGGASDVHLTPAADGLDVRWRLDGVLHEIGRFPKGEAADIVSRLKVLAQLLTYRHDVPQEGRVRRGELAEGGASGGESRASDAVEMRVSTFPTLHGERAVVRLFGGGEAALRSLADLGLPDEITAALTRLLDETSGAILITGPAGSGKTTTLYASLREIVRRAGGSKSIVALEDPIEVAIDGVAQSQVNPAGGFTLATGLRSLMRQDPEVMMVGEIRDRETAEAAFQASLTGHLVLTTFHAGGAASAISRLADMSIEPYQLRSGVRAILSQRLVRRLCDCAEWIDDEAARLGLPVQRVREPRGCADCGQTGYRGRLVLAEMLQPEPSDLGRAILSRDDAARLQQLARQSGMVTLWQRAVAAVEQGTTSPAEVRRVLGWGATQQDLDG